MITTPDTISPMPTKAAASSIWRNSTKETVAVRMMPTPPQIAYAMLRGMTRIATDSA
jgi:hypothetical protein